MTKTLWTKDFIRITLATSLGAAGGIISGFALASALVVAIQLLPGAVLPLLIAPLMDRYPRKPFLVGGDTVNALLYALAGVYLLRCEFSYTVYLGFSLLLACLSAFDELAYSSFYPLILPEGTEEKGYTVSSMLYPVLKVLMMPVAAVLFDTLGVARLLLVQSALSLLSALIENKITVTETPRGGERFSLRLWWEDLREAAAYLKREKGLRALYDYMAVTNGMAAGYSPLLIAFFRTAPGFTAAMYSFFSVAEFAGRSLGGVVRYRYTLPEKKRFPFIFAVYQIYEMMDVLLLWLPYPLMLANRAFCGFLGINSAAIRQAAVQRYIPEALRARVNALFDMMLTAASGVCALAVGALGEVLDYRLCVTLCGAVAMAACWLLIWGRRAAVRGVYEKEDAA